MIYQQFYGTYPKVKLKEKQILLDQNEALKDVWSYDIF